MGRKQFRGFVDIITGVDDATTYALVFKVVYIKGFWKVSCGYFQIDGLSGDEKANLVDSCLEKLHDVGVKVASPRVMGLLLISQC